jgi:hypothetical protein
MPQITVQDHSKTKNRVRRKSIEIEEPEKVQTNILLMSKTEGGTNSKNIFQNLHQRQIRE